MPEEKQKAERPKQGAKPVSLGRHKANCTVCAQEKREEIEAEFVTWRSPAVIATDAGRVYQKACRAPGARWPAKSNRIKASHRSHPRSCAVLARLTIGLPPPGQGFPSCPTSRCLIMALMLLHFSRFSSVSSQNDTSLDLRIFFTSRNTWTAASFKVMSCSHIHIAPATGDSTIRVQQKQPYFRTPLAPTLFARCSPFWG